MNIIQKVRSFYWWHWLLAICLFFIAVTTSFHYIPELRVKWHVFYHFTLAGEMIIAAWWSSVALLIVALIAYELFSTKSDANGKAWLIISLIFLGLSLDEVGSLHERVNEWRKMFWYILAGGLLLAYALIPLYRNRLSRKSAVLIALGFVFFGLAAVQEYFEHNLIWPDWTIGLRVGAEEGAEMAGVFLCLWAVIEQRKRTLADRSFRLLIPNPLLMSYLPVLIVIGLAAHIALTTMTVSFPDLDKRGNPAMWYPLVIFFILAAASYWRCGHTNGRINRVDALLIVFLLLSSAGTVYHSRLIISDNIWYLGILTYTFFTAFSLRFLTGSPIPYRAAWLVLAAYLLVFAIDVARYSRLELGQLDPFRLLSNLYFLSQILFLIFFYLKIRGPVSGGHFATVSFLPLLIFGAFITDILALQFTAIGLAACGFAVLFLMQLSPERLLAPQPEPAIGQP